MFDQMFQQSASKFAIIWESLIFHPTIFFPNKKPVLLSLKSFIRGKKGAQNET